MGLGTCGNVEQVFLCLTPLPAVAMPLRHAAWHVLQKHAFGKSTGSKVGSPALLHPQTASQAAGACPGPPNGPAAAGLQHLLCCHAGGADLLPDQPRVPRVVALQAASRPPLEAVPPLRWACHQGAALWILVPPNPQCQQHLPRHPCRGESSEHLLGFGHVKRCCAGVPNVTFLCPHGTHKEVAVRGPLQGWRTRTTPAGSFRVSQSAAGTPAGDDRVKWWQQAGQCTWKVPGILPLRCGGASRLGP